MIKEYFNLIGWKHFRPWLKNKIFPVHVVFTEPWRTLSYTIFKVRKDISGLNFWQNPKTLILEEFLRTFPKMRIFPSKNLSVFGPLASCIISEKLYEPFLRKTDNWPTDRLNYWHTDRDSFIGSFPPESRGPESVTKFIINSNNIHIASTF